jgi:hypothetical protein
MSRANEDIKTDARRARLTLVVRVVELGQHRPPHDFVANGRTLRILHDARCVMKNPFEYGGAGSGHAFYNREAEKTDLLKAIRNNEKLFVFSEGGWI